MEKEWRTKVMKGTEGVENTEREERNGEETKAETGTTRATRLIDRDRQVLLAVKEARYLSSRQLARLFFAGRHASAWQSRLKQLEGEGLLERHVLRYVDRSSELCWGLTAEGRVLTDGWVGEESDAGDELQLESLEHHLFFAELYVGLLEAPVARRVSQLPARLGRLERQQALALLYARADHPAWRWRTGSTLHLPWREYAGGVTKDRLIRPDAVLEVPASRLRVFIEGETGSQPLKSRSKDRHGATTAKLRRYQEYMMGLADGATHRTWYQERFPDGFAAELLVLVPQGRRETNTQRIVDEWRGKAGTQRLPVRVATMDEALRHYGALAGIDVAVAPRPVASATGPLTPEGLRVVRAFFTSARADLKKRQADAEKLQRQHPGHRVDFPVVPARYEEMKALVAQLEGAP